MKSEASNSFSTNSESSWYQLRLFNYYRGTLSLFFLTLYLNGWINLFIAPKDLNPLLFFGTSLFYLSAFFVFILGIQQHKPDLKTQTIIHVCTDIIAIMIITHACGGIKSGLGMLLVINISLTSLFLPRNLTMLLAAATTLAILFDQTYSYLVTSNFKPAFVHAGILGTLILTFAYLASGIARQLRDTEQVIDEQVRELETATQLNEHIIKNMRTGIMVLSAKGNILMSNNAAEALLGNIKLHKNTSLKKILPDLHQRFIEWQSNNKTQQQTPIQQNHGLPDIQPGFSSIEKNKGRTLVFLEDATQLNQRFQQVKLASLGRLTASIAHEIRNPLAAIQHASQLLEESTDDPANKKLTRIITTQTRRLNGVVKNVLQLSRKQNHAPEPIILNNWLIDFKNEFCPTYGMTLEQIQIDISPDSLTIIFEPEQLHQILWNLCTNTINHAGLDTQQIIINIKGNISESAHQLILDIMDNGRGINRDIESRIFEPFYTTSTEGTGLGLYIIKEIVETNRAKIKYVSSPDKGSCFRIFFMLYESNQVIDQ